MLKNSIFATRLQHITAPYFMLLLKAKQVQKTTAAFLLLAMFCINAVKLSHTHSTNTGDKHGHGYANINPGFKCLICDYELTKDADPAIAAFHIATPVTSTIQNSIACLFTPSQVFSFFVNRGPPAIG